MRLPPNKCKQSAAYHKSSQLLLVSLAQAVEYCYCCCCCLAAGWFAINADVDCIAFTLESAARGRCMCMYVCVCVRVCAAKNASGGWFLWFGSAATTPRTLSGTGKLPNIVFYSCFRGFLFGCRTSGLKFNSYLVHILLSQASFKRVIFLDLSSNRLVTLGVRFKHKNTQINYLMSICLLTHSAILPRSLG